MKAEEDAIVTLGITIPVDPSQQSNFHSMHSHKLSNALSDFDEISEDNFCNLPCSLDPNLGILGELSSDMLHVTRTFNAWNIDPQFSYILPLSTPTSCESSILIFGGLNPSSVLTKHPPDFDHNDYVLGSTIFQYLLSSGLWKYYGTMIEPRCYHACVLLGQYVYITGGYSLIKRKHGEMLAISSTDRLNLNDRQWKRCSSMIVARAFHTVVSHKEYLYAFGGRNSQGSILSSVEIYYPDQDMWIEITSLPQPCMGLSATCVMDAIWIMGGITYDVSVDPSKCLLSTVYSFIPTEKRWHTENPLPYACAFSSCIFNYDSLFLIGGCTSINSKKGTLASCSNVLQCTLSEKPSTWKLTTSLLYPRHAVTAVLYDDFIYVLAGMESNNNCASSKVEVISTVTNACIEYTDIPVAITGCTSVLISEEIRNYMCMKWDSHVEASNAFFDSLEGKIYLNNMEESKGHMDYYSETNKDFSTLEDICERDRNNYISPITDKNHLVAESSQNTIFKSAEIEDSFVHTSSKKTISNQEFLHKNSVSSSYSENKFEKSENNYKYRASMEIFLNSNGDEDVLSYDVRKNRSSASKWLHFFKSLSISDEKLHNEIFQSKELKLNIKSKVDAVESDESWKSTEMKDFEADKKLDIASKCSHISTCLQSSASSHEESFMYIQSNLKSKLLEKVSDAERFESKDVQESFDSISTQKPPELEMDILPVVPSETEKIAIDVKSLPVILLMGGECEDDDIKCRYILSYHCAKNTWEYVGYMPEYRCHHSVAFLKNKIYIIGGFDSKNSRLNENITRKTLCYDTCEETWYHIAEMNDSRAHHCSVVLKNEIFIFGGRDQLGNILSSVEAYNESTDEWRKCKSLSYPVLGASSTIVNGLLHIFGGITYKDENEIISYYSSIFNPEDNSWSLGSDLPIPLAFCGISSSSNSVWLFGGLKEKEENIVSEKDIYKYDVLTDNWSKVAKLSVSRLAPVTVSIGNKVFVIGGHSTEEKKEILICEQIDILKNEVLIKESLPSAISGRAGIAITEIDESATETN